MSTSPKGSLSANDATNAHPHPVSRFRWVIWLVGALAYAIAVTQRTTLGPAGTTLLDRFDTVPSILSVFVFVQLIVYSVMQIPSGVLVDRFGPRATIATGAGIMAVAQIAVGLSHGTGLIIAARILLGIGDALTFTSAIRLTEMWFPGKSTPLMMQLTQSIGQLGQIVSAIPFAILLHMTGWVPSFLSAGAVSLIVMVAVVAVVRTAPGISYTSQRAKDVVAGIGKAWKNPGTRLGAFVHMSTQFAGSVFVVLWGVPFMTLGLHLPVATASAYVALYAVLAILLAPIIGKVTGSFPQIRIPFAVAVVLVNAVALALVTSLPTPTPTWAIILWIAMLSLTNPTSIIGQDFARATIPNGLKGTAIGTVNMGGWTATPVAVIVIGLVLDFDSHGSVTPTLANYRAAFSVEYVIWAIGLVLIFFGNRTVKKISRRRSSSPPVAAPSENTHGR